MTAILEPEEHVLSTLERDGRRCWLKPTLSRGIWLRRRRIVAWLLILFFTAVPFIKVGGQPLVLLDVPARRFTIFGYTFLPTDTLLLALLAVGSLLAIFILTALFGRVWCGWACPQTVYMEFLIRPLERFFDGTSGRGGAERGKRPGWFRMLKYPVYLLACFYLANTFLAWFVGAERLGEWITQSPLDHPVPFLIVAGVTVAMMLDFCFYREQICILMCPYGRFQSVLLDPSSLIVSYDAARGEPRGKLRKNPGGGVPLPVVGDCIDCGKCVTTCPTGIDIRKGLQMECINCTQCIDACNDVMEKVGRPANLIRYSSQRRDRREREGLRPRLVVYPLLLSAIFGLLLFLLVTKKPFDAVILRELGQPWSRIEPAAGAETGETQIRNLMRLKLTNRSRSESGYRVELLQPAEARLRLQEAGDRLTPGETATWHFELLSSPATFVNGRADCVLRVHADDGADRELRFKLLGPR
jgi:cytochrome c oxidase accessory protein FixG